MTKSFIYLIYRYSEIMQFPDQSTNPGDLSFGNYQPTENKIKYRCKDPMNLIIYYIVNIAYRMNHGYVSPFIPTQPNFNYMYWGYEIPLGYIHPLDSYTVPEMRTSLQIDLSS